MNRSGSAYLRSLKAALTGDGDVPAVLVCNFEVEAQWAANHVGLPTPAGRAVAPVVTRMDELGVLLAGPGDHLVLKRPIDPEYEAYLREIGFEPPTVLTPAEASADRPTAEDLLNSPAALRELAALADDGARLLPMGTSVAEQKLAETVGLPLAVPDAATFERVNSKIYSRRATEGLGLRRVPGACVESVGDLERVLAGYRDDLPPGGVVVKDAYGVSGKGLVLLDSTTKLDRLLAMVTRRARRTGDDRLAVVVEEWLPKECDLNYQVTVGRDGAVTLDFVKRAITRNGIHQGHTFPAGLTAAHLDELAHAASAIGGRLHGDGFHGVTGIDAILTTTGVLHPVLEINARFNMSTYQGGVTERFGGPDTVALARHHPLRLAAPLRFAALRDALGPLLTSTAPDRVVITCFATVNAEADSSAPPFDGRLYLMLFAPDPARLAALDTAVRAALAPLNHQER